MKTMFAEGCLFILRCFVFGLVFVFEHLPQTIATIIAIAVLHQSCVTTERNAYDCARRGGIYSPQARLCLKTESVIEEYP